MRRTLGVLRPYRWSVIAILALIFMQSLTSLYLPNLMSKIVDEGVVYGRIGYIVHIGEIMLLVSLLAVICSVLAGLLASKASAGFGQILRARVFTHVEQFMLHEFDRVGTSSLIVRTNNDIMQVQQFINMLLRMMVMAPLMALGGIVMAVYTNARLSLILVVVMPVLGLAIWLVLNRGMHLFRVLQTKVDVVNRVVREALSGVRVIRAFHRVDYESGRFDDANRDLTQVSADVFKVMALMMPLVMFVINFSTIGILWYGGRQINDLHMQVGNLMAFIQYVTQIMFSVMMVSTMLFMVPRAQASARRIWEVMDITPEIVDAPTAVGRVPGRGEVRFEDVSFRYPGAETTVLEHLSFAARPGQVTAIIGGTGAGKSTLVHLLLRFFDATSGRILIDGVDVRDYAQADLRQGFGFVPQKAMLFTGTIADNIRYGNPEASLDDVRRAAELAQATEFITAMPDGFDTVIQQGGANLSGGQKQRLAIARALVRRPRIYVFDDSFSALDFKTDARLREAIRPEIAASAVFIVAQRVSTIIDADQILVLDDGRLAGVGTHRELMERSTVYREIVTSQLAEEEIA